MPRIGIILGSTRPNRNGEQVADWVFDIATQRDDAVCGAPAHAFCVRRHEGQPGRGAHAAAKPDRGHRFPGRNSRLRLGVTLMRHCTSGPRSWARSGPRARPGSIIPGMWRCM